MGRLDEKVAIVTGGSLGIGAQYCKSLAKEGAKIVIADLCSERRALYLPRKKAVHGRNS